MKNILGPKFANLKQVALDNKEAYDKASPFPNISFTDFFDSDFLEDILHEFPDLSKGEAIKYDNVKEKKFAGKGEASFGNHTRKLMHTLNSQPFLEFLQELTGIKETLIGDPYFEGGGLHEIKRGGLLKIHADFNVHKSTKLDRRLNVLVYLNKDWEEAYGGHFELWDKEMKTCHKKISPKFNTMAIFSTTDFSFHGHPNPLKCPENMSRKSLALYYYTNGRPENELNLGLTSHGTIFKERENEDNFNKKEIDFKSQCKNVLRDLIPPIIIKLFRK